MFFRNLSLWRLNAETCADLSRLAEALPDHALRDCGSLEMFTRGFVPPVGRDGEPLTLVVGECTVFAIGGQDKILPAAVVNDELRHRVDRIADEEGRRVGGRERKRIKEDLVTEFLPRAFIRTSRSLVYADTAAGWLVIDTSSRKVAENVITQIREALGSFPALPMAPEEGPRILMTDWLSTGNLPAGFALGDECELRDPATATGGIAVCRRQDMDAEEVKEHLRNGKQVFKLGLVFDNRLSFVLGEDLSIRKLRFLDVVMDELGDSAEDAMTEAQATFTLMTLELRRLLDQLELVFGLAIDAPLRMHRQDAPDGMQSRRADAELLSRVEKHLDAKIAAIDKIARMARADGATVTLSTGGGEVIATFGDGPDPLQDAANDVVRTSGRASISTVQRLMRVGYNRAARLIEQMEKDGIVSAPQANGAREVLQPTPT